MRDSGTSDGETRTRTGDTTIFQSWRRISLTAAESLQIRHSALAYRVGRIIANCGLFSPIWALRRASVPNEVAGIAKNLDKEPKIVTPEGAPPADMVVKDIVKGKAAKAKAGEHLTMQYVGYSWSTGEKFDASWDRGREPFPFQLGAGMVIGGWDQGMVGMLEGGRRLLIIPSDLGYGEAGAGGTIGPNERLIFAVDLEKIG
jgi:peptidylprolyl isomerase